MFENFLNKLHLTEALYLTTLVSCQFSLRKKVLKLRPANLKLRMANIVSQGKSNNFITNFAVRMALRFEE